MKRSLWFPLMFVAWVACRGSGDRHGEQKKYETVQEGSAAGVTSTIHGPGEVLPPITNTNADTTTAFTIDPNAVGTAPAPLAPSALPGASPTMPMSPPQTTTMLQPQPPQKPVQPRPVQPEPERPQPVTPRPKPKPRPPEPEPVAPTMTDTTGTPPPTQTDTNAEPEEPKEEERPPPPTMTDTRGREDDRTDTTDR